VDSFYYHDHYYPNRPALPPGTVGGDTPELAPEPVPTDGAPALSLGAPSVPHASADRAAAAHTSSPAPSVTARLVDALRRRGRRAEAIAVVVLTTTLLAAGYYGMRARHLATRGPSPTAAAAGSFQVLATVKGPTDVRIEQDGRLLYEGPLAIGPQVYEAKDEVVVWASQPNAIEISVNGHALGPLGPQGSMPKLRRFTAADAEAESGPARSDAPTTATPDAERANDRP